MPKFVTEEQLQRLRESDEDSFPKHAYGVIRERVYRSASYPGIQPGDPEDWWSMSERRLRDAAFVWYVERDPALGEWIRNIAFWIRDLEDVDWIGPWFRSHARPLVGQLETAHVSAAMCYTLDFCDELFTSEEKDGLKKVLRENGMELCRRFCDGTLENGTSMNNWYSVLLMGYGMATLVLEEEEEIRHTLELMKVSQRIYNRDSYGEPLNYCDYASSVLMRLQETLLCFRPDLRENVSLDCYARMTIWQASSFLYMKKWNEQDKIPDSRYINFGDCDANYKPRAEMLAHVAARCRQTHPKEAALASWMFHIFYTGEIDGSDVNGPDYSVINLYPDMAQPKSPAELGLDAELFFENGHAILRDRWEEPRSVAAMRIGYQSLNACAHHHQDFGSFQFVLGKERMVVDGGSCCYRTHSHKFSASILQHSTVDFLDAEQRTEGFNRPVSPYAGVIGQTLIGGWFGSPEKPMAHTVRNEKSGAVRIIAVDLSELYGDDVPHFTRIFLCGLPGFMIILDYARTVRPLSMRTHFPMNNRDGKLEVQRLDQHHYAFARFGESMRIAEYLCMVDGKEQPSHMQMDWGFCHKHYSSRPNEEGQGKEGTIELYNWVDAVPGYEHLRICTILTGSETETWMEEEDGKLIILSREAGTLLSLRIQGGQVYLLGDSDSDETPLL